MSPNKKLSPLPEMTALERANHCRAFLVTHGFMTGRESQEVKNRLKKWAKNQTEGSTANVSVKEDSGSANSVGRTQP